MLFRAWNSVRELCCLNAWLIQLKYTYKSHWTFLNSLVFASVKAFYFVQPYLLDKHWLVQIFHYVNQIMSDCWTLFIHCIYVHTWLFRLCHSMVLWSTHALRDLVYVNPWNRNMHWVKLCSCIYTYVLVL